MDFKRTLDVPLSIEFLYAPLDDFGAAVGVTPNVAVCSAIYFAVHICCCGAANVIRARRVFGM
jgi:hypothetical protein